MEKNDKFVQSIYCYDGTTILKNKLNIMDKDELRKREVEIVDEKRKKLLQNSNNGNFPFEFNLNINNYIGIHKYLFEDIYYFAGEIRSEVINKKNQEVKGEEGIRTYCYPDFIYSCLENELKIMKREATNIKNREALITFLSKHYMELYYIHPFREGNTRTLREFMREYVMAISMFILKEHNYEIDYSILDDKDYENFVRSLIWNTSIDHEKQEKSFSLLYSVFDKCVVETKGKEMKKV